MRKDGIEGLPKHLKNWIKYERVRMSGEYNMVTEAVEASSMADLSLEDYWVVKDNYVDLAEEAITTLGRDNVEELTTDYFRKERNNA